MDWRLGPKLPHVHLAPGRLSFLAHSFSHSFHCAFIPLSNSNSSSDSEHLLFPWFQALFLVLCTECLIMSSNLPNKEDIPITSVLLMRTSKPRGGKTQTKRHQKKSCPIASASFAAGSGNQRGTKLKLSAHACLFISWGYLHCCSFLSLRFSVHRTGPAASSSLASQ